MADYTMIPHPTFPSVLVKKYRASKQSKLHGSHLKLTRIHLYQDGSAAYVPAYDVRPEVFCLIPYKVAKCYVHRDYRSNGTLAKTWAVTDANTGACLTWHQPTADAAIRRAVTLLRSKTQEEYLGAIRRTTQRAIDAARKHQGKPVQQDGSIAA